MFAAGSAATDMYKLVEGTLLYSWNPNGLANQKEKAKGGDTALPCKTQAEKLRTVGALRAVE